MSFSEMSKQITIIFLTDTLLCYTFNFSASLSTWNYYEYSEMKDLVVQIQVKDILPDCEL